MFIHPLGKANTTVSNVTDEMVQPNAIDLKVKDIFVQSEKSTGAMILKDETRHGEYVRTITDGKHFALQPQTFYQFETEHFVEIADGEVGWLVHRSSLARNGVFVTSGVYDAGFRGNIGGVMYNASNKVVVIEKGARVAQLLLSASESVTKYDGQYQDTGVVSVKKD